MLPLGIFLAGLGVDGLGEGVVENVREKMPNDFDTIDDWIKTNKLVTHAVALSMRNTGEAIHNRLLAKRTLIQNLFDAGVTIDDNASKGTVPVVSDGPAKGMIFCLTGSFPEVKAHYYQMIRAAGGEIEEDFRSTVTHVVVKTKDGKATGKRAKAEKNGIPVLDLTEFMALVAPDEATPGIRPGELVLPAGQGEQVRPTGTADEPDGYPE